MSQTASPAAEIRYPSLEYVQCPYPLHRHLLEEAPIYLVPATGEYLISRHADVSHVLRHPEIFSAALAREHAREQTGASTSAIYDEASREHHARIASAIETDPPEHKAKRDLCFEGFKPGRLRHAESRLTEIVDELIDRFAERGEVEFVAEFAAPLPILAFCALFFGDAESDYAEFSRWATIEGSGLTYLPPDRQAAAKERTAGLGDYLEVAISARYDEPTGDVLSEMIRRQSERDGELNIPYLQSEAGLLLAGGFVTTQHLLSNTLVLLLRSPAVLDRLRRDPTGITRVLEESLRLEPPVQWQRRVTSCETVVGDVTIPAGSVVLVILAAANRDGARFDEAEEFDPDRPTLKQHMAFGLGTHFCLGAPLARMEGRIAFERLLARFDHIEAAIDLDRVVYIENPEFRGPQALPLRLR